MFKGFNLEFSKNSTFKSFLRLYKEHGEILYNNKKKEVRQSLDTYLGVDGYLDCTKLQEEWFPSVKSNVFISHSHNDEDLAIGLAGWLHKDFGLTTFIDSYVWGYCNDLLREIDNKYCKFPDQETYDYSKRNYSTSHVHMMLSTALTKMIDKTECIIFINTDKSIINTKDAIKTKTQSPWIYAEILSTTLVKERMPERLKVKKSDNEIKHIDQFEMYNNILKVTYDVDLKHLVLLPDNKLQKLIGYNSSNLPTDALDRLYELVGVLQK